MKLSDIKLDPQFKAPSKKAAPACPDLPAAPSGPLDLDRLARAVAVAETSNCTAGQTAVSRNNCHGIMTWKGGSRTLRTFASPGESHAHFKGMWLRVYGNRFPTLADAKLYTGNDSPCTWMANVIRNY